MAKDTTPLSGADILKDVESSLINESAERLKGGLRRTLKAITDRKQWIEARTAQIEELKKLQVKLVKTYDSGKLDARAYDKLVAEITAVENDKASDSRY